MHDGSGQRGGEGSRRSIVTDFPPTLVKRVAGTFRRILQEVPPGDTRVGPVSPALAKHVTKTFADIVLLSVERGLPHLAPRPKRGQ